MENQEITTLAPDRERFAELEEIIERNIKSFIEAGNALWEIRDSGYYHITHKSFEGYCTERWGIRRNYADRLIRSAKAVDRIASTPQVAEEVVAIGTASIPQVTEEAGTTVPVLLPTTESQARELAKAPVEDQAEVWEEVVQTTAVPTAKAIKAVVERRKKAKAKPDTVSALVEQEPEASDEPAEESLPNGGKTYRHDALMPEWYRDGNGIAVPEELYPVWRMKKEYARLSQDAPSFELVDAFLELGKSLNHQPTIDFATDLKLTLNGICAEIRRGVGQIEPSVVIDGKWYSKSEVASA